ncbi:MAG: dTDP-4-amino-4,6-dideoxygalactose transaminase [Bacteroidales bacterium]|nr:dTDP-4-amino-4,6-dideoxygalactose transaminase [Bacteroidales bacterium]
MFRIPFNKPHFTGREASHVSVAVKLGKISGNGEITKRCHEFFESRYHFRKVLLTTSCTDALEMAAILCRISEGDEVIMPSYTFVSTANAFVLRGARIVFADSSDDSPNIDASSIEALITPRTKAIVVVHYAGFGCDMDEIMRIAGKYKLLVVEDAAHSIDSYYRNKPLGSIGHLATFSFHETKNISCGEGGMLVINDESLAERAEIIWEKGTNRAAFSRGEVDKYGWVDIGSSFLPSELTAAFLMGQLEMIDDIQQKRLSIFNCYYQNLLPLDQKGLIRIPHPNELSSGNGHLFYLLAKNLAQRDQIIQGLKKSGIQAVFHYLPLHSSKFFSPLHDGRLLPNADRYSETLVRLPFFYDLRNSEIDEICSVVRTILS